MAEQQLESPELKDLKDISEAIDAEVTRLARTHSKGKLNTTALVAEELVNTLLPLVSDLAKATIAHASSVEEWAEEVEETLEGEETVSGLGEEEIELFGWLFERLGEFVDGVKNTPNVSEDTLKAMSEIESKLSDGVSVLANFVEDEEDDNGVGASEDEGEENADADGADGDSEDGDSGESSAD